MANIRALLGKIIYGVPPSVHEASAPPTRYIPEHMLPEDVDAQPWRVDASGVLWFIVGGPSHD